MKEEIRKLWNEYEEFTRLKPEWGRNITEFLEWLITTDC